MKKNHPEMRLRRVLDALETELLNATPEDIEAAVVETGMSRGALFSVTIASIVARSVEADSYKALGKRGWGDQPEGDETRHPHPIGSD